VLVKLDPVDQQEVVEPLLRSLTAANRRANHTCAVVAKPLGIKVPAFGPVVVAAG
jgi:hypothetical protein